MKPGSLKRVPRFRRDAGLRHHLRSSVARSCETLSPMPKKKRTSEEMRKRSDEMRETATTMQKSMADYKNKRKAREAAAQEKKDSR